MGRGRFLRRIAPVVLCLAFTDLSGSAQQAGGPFRDMRFRSIGPAVMGGRIHDVTALPNDPSMVILHGRPI